MSQYDSDKHHRHSTRLEGWDYRNGGAYFITMVAHERDTLFGKIVDGIVDLSPYGEIVQEEWLNSANLRQNIELDEFVVMPNHLHAIVWIKEASALNEQALLTAAQHNLSASATHPANPKQLHRSSGSLSSMLAGFKSATTKRINELRSTPRVSVWQSNYHDRIVRNERELAAFRQYIHDNPAHWQEDSENPNR
jgi:putative transposase